MTCLTVLVSMINLVLTLNFLSDQQRTIYLMNKLGLRPYRKVSFSSIID